MSGKVGSTIGLLLAGVVLGVLALGMTRLTALPAEEPGTHYHANWAVFVDGQRLDLSAERYMEDVVRCKADPTQVDPQDRVHMHNRDHDVVHVHHGGATWGHFLANLGFAVGDDFLYTDTGERYGATPERTLKFVLNGREVPSIRNRLIESEDRLLISYGPESAVEAARTQFPQVAANAGEHNLLPDPGACGGAVHAHGGSRLRRAFWF
jgi:hypothetical protein